jgi:hypothetical protein
MKALSDDDDNFPIESADNERADLAVWEWALVRAARKMHDNDSDEWILLGRIDGVYRLFSVKPETIITE